MNYAKKYFQSISEALNSSIYKLNDTDVSSEIMFKGVNEILLKVKKNDGRIYFLGNGASAAFANHMALDFSKNGKIMARSLSDSAMLTALANDYSFNSAMTEFLKIESVNCNDFVITISSSGNSGNIINSLDYCRSNNVETLALSGLKNDNKSIELSKNSIYVPMKTYGIVECVHQIFLHLILDNYMQIFEWDRDTFQNMNHQNFKL
jgi:D-sedoheptulose 7-phosphate isomerase